MKQRGSGFIQIEPFNIANLNPNSYDLTLYKELECYESNYLDPRNKNSFKTYKIEIPEKEGFTLQKGRCYLARTNEYTVTSNYVPTLHGKSGIGRMFLDVCSLAGYGDIGFAGFWTIQLIPNLDTVVYRDMKICQIQYETVEGIIRHVYTGKYQNSDYIVPSKVYEEFDNIKQASKGAAKSLEGLAKKARQVSKNVTKNKTKKNINNQNQDQ